MHACIHNCIIDYGTILSFSPLHNPSVDSKWNNHQMYRYGIYFIYLYVYVYICVCMYLYKYISFYKYRLLLHSKFKKRFIEHKCVSLFSNKYTLTAFLMMRGSRSLRKGAKLSAGTAAATRGIPSPANSKSIASYSAWKVKFRNTCRKVK